MRRNFLGKAYNYLLRHEEWNIGILHEPISVLLQGREVPDIDWLPSPNRHSYFVDPFGISYQGKTYVLCEEFEYKRSKGRIVSIELDDDFSPSNPIPSMEFPFHTSYPCLLEFENNIYCVPETANAQEISLYEAVHFPSSWRKVRTLVHGFAGHDPTVFSYKGRWWLAFTGEFEEDRFSKLFIWSATSLFDPWRPHKANPVKINLRSSRPAGTPFIHNGALYRPAQDCSIDYGSQIVINRVLSLTEKEFIEEEAAIVKPDSKGPYPSGLHTITQAGQVTLVDGRRLALNPTAFKYALIHAPSEFSKFLRSR